MNKPRIIRSGAFLLLDFLLALLLVALTLTHPVHHLSLLLRHGRLALPSHTLQERDDLEARPRFQRLSLIKAELLAPLIHGEQINGLGELAMMNRFQSCVARAYAEGAYATLANSDSWRKDIDELGDGLFRYLILELATGENCESWPEAIMRTEICVYELEQVSAALRTTYLQEKPDGQSCHALPLRDLDR